jgi:hypothetical protein
MWRLVRAVIHKAGGTVYATDLRVLFVDELFEVVSDKTGNSGCVIPVLIASTESPHALAD